jgi:hypothetical protein
MMPVPRVVLASLSAIGSAGAVFSVSTALGGAPGVSAMYLTLPLAAAACFRVLRFARFSLFLVSILAMAPLMVGVVLTWPHVPGVLPYAAGMVTIFAGLSGMLSPVAREWHASVSAHRLLGID